MRRDTVKCMYAFSINSFMHQKAIEAAEAMVGASEVIHFISPSNMKVVPRNTNRGKNYTGVIVITDCKVYICHKAGWDTGAEVFDMRDLVRVSYTANGLSAAEFTLTMQDANISFIASYDKKMAATLYEEINSLIRKQNDAPAYAAACDPVTEIRKYKELLDIGAITQDEFNAKKKQLLGL